MQRMSSARQTRRIAAAIRAMRPCSFVAEPGKRAHVLMLALYPNAAGRTRARVQTVMLNAKQ